MAFYALLDPNTTDTDLEVVIKDDRQYLTNGTELHVTSQPRRLRIPRVTLLDLLARGDTLAHLNPRGDVTVQPDDGHTCEAGWTITSRGTVDPVLGPQAAQLRNIVGLHEELRGSGPVGLAYDRVINAQWDGPDWRQQAYADAARNALNNAGAHGGWWAGRAAGCTGGELLAEAAWDLIGTVAGWDVPAYAELTWPLRAGLAVLRPGRLSHPIHDPQFVRGWYSAVPPGNPDMLSLCRHCGSELLWHGDNTYGNHIGETECVPGRPQRHEPLPRPSQESGT